MTTRRARSPSAPRVPAEQREVILQRLRDGHDFASSCAVGGIDTQVAVADHEFHTACGKAHAIGSGRLKARLLEKAIQNSDTHVLERALVGRERQQQGFPTDELVERDDDGGFSARLRLLSDYQLSMVEWALEGIGERPEPIVYVDVWPSAQAVPPRPGRAGELNVLDEHAPLPRNRSIVKAAVVQPPDSDSLRNLAATDPGAAFSWLLHGPRGGGAA
jgi:hypothetical protein